MFGTQIWADNFKNSLANNPNYIKSIEKWDGTIVLLFIAENNRLKEDVRLYLDIHPGEIRGARFLEEGEEVDNEFTFVANETAWDLLIQDKVKPTKLLMTGKFKIKGNVGKINRHISAAGYIIKYIRRYLKDW
jgi:putative sterol carrier protein